MPLIALSTVSPSFQPCVGIDIFILIYSQIDILRYPYIGYTDLFLLALLLVLIVLLVLIGPFAVNSANRINPVPFLFYLH